MSATIGFQAHASGHATCTADTARDAAVGFFASNPKARKCSVIEGTRDGLFFTIAYGIGPNGNRPLRFSDVTRKTLETIPA